ncbi:MAG: hypothetical protein R3272_10620 [Candidatus Promineifilaceae bacterium]|nr:hypothetical protein [Candidatus Promineifilaceae bacterium]
MGRTRQEGAQELLERFDLEEAAEARMDDVGVLRRWQAYVQIRLEHYPEEDLMETVDRLLAQEGAPAAMWSRS